MTAEPHPRLVWLTAYFEFAKGAGPDPGPPPDPMAAAAARFADRLDAWQDPALSPESVLDTAAVALGKVGRPLNRPDQGGR